MYYMIGEANVIMVMTDIELSELTPETCLIITDPYEFQYLLAITDTELTRNAAIRMSKERKLPLIDILSEQIPGLKEGKMVSCQDVSRYPLYLSGEGIIEKLGYSKKDVSHSRIAGTTVNLQ